MGNLTFVHTADCHLDTPFSGIAREDPALAETLRGLQRQAFDDLIGLCCERRAAFLVIAGDLFDSRERSLSTRVHLRDCFRRLEREGIEVFLATGNHDYVDPRERQPDLPDNVHVFSQKRAELIRWPKDRPEVAIAGISYGRRDMGENLARRFPRPPRGLFSIAVLHCNLEGDPRHDNYAPCRREDLLHLPYNYWALGHIHERRVLREGATTIAYPGCIQARHINESGEKGALVVTVEPSGDVRTEFVGLDRVRWVVEEVDVSEAESDEQLVELLRSRAEALGAGADERLRGLIVRWHLRGELGCDPALLPDVLESLRSDLSDRALFVWSESIDASATRPPVAPDELAREESPRGDLVRLAERIRKDPAELEKLRALLLEVSGPPTIGREIGREGGFDEIFDEAVRLGVAMLSRSRKK